MSYHQTIYNLLRGYGLSEAGALGMLGNWECESDCEPYRVQGDYQSSRAISKAYVNAIETGMSDKERFATDQKGFGLAQGLRLGTVDLSTAQAESVGLCLWSDETDRFMPDASGLCNA